MILRPSAVVAMRGSNGGVVPQVERIDRLHVVMAVEQHVRRRRAFGLLADHDRMARGRPHSGVEAERRRSAATQSAAARHAPA